MRFLSLLLIFLGILSFAGAQKLPHHMTRAEEKQMKTYLENISSKGITTPPQGSLRTPAEWEEIDYLTMTWEDYDGVLAEVVRHAQKEVPVIIHCEDSMLVKNELNNNGVSPANVEYIQVPTNSVWIRDYGARNVYKNDVDSLILVDWIYNRPRPDDDAIPERTASHLGIPIYSTTQAPYKLVNTGGNFMTDGFGTAFSSNLILDENPNLSATEVDSIMYKFMGIDTFIHMPNLPYDNIHHIDMHMKLLDEETLLVGKYPQGVADGPQIEANLQYVLNNFSSAFGDKFRVVRIPMPPSLTGSYPDQGAYYRTYTNSVFVNNTLLVPTYYQKYDTTALRILRENLPGYKVVGINSNSIIPASGAIHCITNSIGSSDPLLISHQPFRDTVTSPGQYVVHARIQHRSGIQYANVHYTTDTTAGFQSLPMTSNIYNHWVVPIPAQSAGQKVYYYISATANSGKKMTRPMPAPNGYWSFVADPNTGIIENDPVNIRMKTAFPNPANAITAVPVTVNQPVNIRLSLYDVAGRLIEVIADEKQPKGKQHYFFNAGNYAPGTYVIKMQAGNCTDQQKVLIQ